MMHGHRKSDSSIVPENSPNKDRSGSAEVREGRELTEGNPLEQNTLRTQGRESIFITYSIGGFSGGVASEHKET